MGNTQMNCFTLIDNIARQLKSTIENYPDTELMSTPDYGWENYRYHSRHFRLAHIEIFKQSSFMVVHCCVFPYVTDPNPIYGFDVVAGPNKITGVFMDLSPTVLPAVPFAKLDFGVERMRPDWGDIFSEHWLAARPTVEEMDLIGVEAHRVLDEYLVGLGKFGEESEIIKAQNYYCNQQRKNQHTRKMLANLLGDAKADEFMTNILFPTV